MSHPDRSSEEIAQQGKEIYRKLLRAQVETADNIGKIIAIEASQWQLFCVT